MDTAEKVLKKMQKLTKKLLKKSARKSKKGKTNARKIEIVAAVKDSDAN